MRRARLVAFSSLFLIGGCRPSASSSSSATQGEASVDAQAGTPAAIADAASEDAGWRDMTDAAPANLSADLQSRLRARANEVLAALKSKDTAALAALSDPVRGVRFSPYSYVDPHDVRLTPADLRHAMNDSHVRNWGSSDGSGAPINETFRAYFKRFVWPADFSKAPEVGVDHGESTGNTIDNIAEAYPKAHFVELYYPGFDPKFGGMDWTSLRLVFEEAKTDGGSTLWLVGIIHGQWTI